MLDRFARFSLAIAEIDRCWHKLAAEEILYLVPVAQEQHILWIEQHQS